MSRGTETNDSTHSLRVPAMVARQVPRVASEFPGTAHGSPVEWRLAQWPGPDDFSRCPLDRETGRDLLGDEGASGEVEHQTSIHLLIKIEVEVVGRLLRIAKLRLFAPPLQQSFASSSELIGDQTGDQSEGCHGFGLGLTETRLQHGCHIAQP